MPDLKDGPTSEAVVHTPDLQGGPCIRGELYTLDPKEMTRWPLRPA